MLRASADPGFSAGGEYFITVTRRTTAELFQLRRTSFTQTQVENIPETA